ncbi:nucleotide exchange factor GrpE [Ilumatobacter sp.]|uniref:nucleotide exchange factor GrpE n=1 Tax=Ilumatobacter sp. TaxID=1967498 RepID=UPI003AF91A59
MSDAGAAPDRSVPGDDERGSEVDDYTGQIPRVDADDADAEPDGAQPSGFGDGDVADIEIDDDATFDALVDGLDLDDAPAAQVDVTALIAERDQFKDAAMRVQADFENYRKRSASQAAGDVDRATGRLAEAFLPVLDAAEAAYLQHPDEVGPLLNVLLAELKKHGLETLDLESQPFDPEVAEAVAHEPGDGGDVVVAEVLRSGYRWKGRTLRPAMVRTKD